MTADSDRTRPVEVSESEIASSKRVAAILREVFDAAEGERSRILAHACAGDEALRRRVQELVDSEGAPRGLLSTPAVEHAAALLGEQDAGSGVPPPSSEEDRRLGPYRTARKLGEGGMRIVYDACGAILSRASRRSRGGHDPDPAELGNSLFLLGGLYASAGDPAAARRRLEQALAMREKEHGADSPEVAACHDALATTLIQLGEFDLAAAHQERAVAVAEKSFETDNPLLAIYWGNLGIARGRGGHLDVAQTAYERAIELWEHVRGEEHPGMAKALSKLACLYRDSGELENSGAHFLRAQAIFEAGLGKRRPSAAQNLEDYALLLRKMGRDVEAEEAESRARTIRDELKQKPDAPGS